MKLLEHLQAVIPKQEIINQQISKASVGWHIEHSLLTINLIIENLQNSDPQKYRWKFNFIRTLIYTINKIPRGKAQSPKAVRPKTICSSEALQIHIDLTKEKMKVLQSLNRNNYFEHPFFGKLNLKPAIKFLGLHTKHHLHIISDILKGNTA